MNLYQVLKRPILTEKTDYQRDNNQYIFEVDRQANKIQIKQAVETIFKVNVVRVNTITVPGKKRRGWRRPVYGSTAKWKKAIVTLQEGQRIEFSVG